MFAGGMLGTLLSAKNWGRFNKPSHKIIIALSLQLFLSFLYPDYTFFTLALLGIAVGLMAPLGIYLFKEKQQLELFFALAIAYTVGTYFYNTEVELRFWMAISFSAVALLSAFILRNYTIQTDTKQLSHSFLSYFPLILWIFLDSNLFETISRHAGINIWQTHTSIIIIFHFIGLLTAYFIKTSPAKNHIIISILFFLSYMFSYLEIPLALAIIYPLTISYYNVVVFTQLTKEISLSNLAFIMLFVGWIASGLGLSLALSGLVH